MCKFPPSCVPSSVGCVEKLENGLYDMPDSCFYGTWYKKHVCEVVRQLFDRGNLISYSGSYRAFITKNFCGFMVLKTTGLSSRFQCKNRFWKICTGSRYIEQNVWKYESLVWRPKFWHILLNISGLGANFSKPIFVLRPWAQAGRFEYHEPQKRNEIFFELERADMNLNMRFPLSKSYRTTTKLHRHVFYIMYHKNNYQAD